MPPTHRQTALQAPTGIDDFFDLINPKYPRLYVDRSLWVQQIFEENAKVLAFHTFRRSGKSLTASMLEYFFAPQVGTIETEGMFNHLKLGQENPDFAKEHQGKYPVIAMTLKNVQGVTFEETATSLCGLIKDTYLKYSYLKASSFLSHDEKAQFSMYAAALETDPLNFKIWEKSFLRLTIYLEKHHQKRVMIIIDEYDAPLVAGAQHGFLPEITAFMRELLGAALKSNQALEKAVLFGIIRFSKESFLSGLNNIQVYTLLQPGHYHPYFGFSKEEVVRLLQQADISLDYLEEIRRW